MFRGNCPTRLDEKGRLKIPADFKHEIDRKYDGRFYLTSLDGAVIKLYPMQEWEQVEAAIQGGPGTYQQKERFKQVTGYYGQVLEMDTQGRVTVAEWLRNKFALKGEVALLGMMDHIEIRIMEQIESYVEANPLTGDELNNLFGSRN